MTPPAGVFHLAPVLLLLPLLLQRARPREATELQAGGGIVGDVVEVEHGRWAQNIHFHDGLLGFLPSLAFPFSRALPFALASLWGGSQR